MTPTLHMFKLDKRHIRIILLLHKPTQPLHPQLVLPCLWKFFPPTMEIGLVQSSTVREAAWADGEVRDLLEVGPCETVDREGGF